VKQTNVSIKTSCTFLC